METKFGFREHAHTADWELEVWAPDLPTLLEQAAHGMYTLAGVHLQGSPHQRQMLIIPANDIESLLVQFLSNLLWFEEDKHLGFDQFEIKIFKDDTYNLLAQLTGSTITSMDKEIKAVTYHNLKVETTPDGWRVNIVFDV
jgi:SHS2 domain-containing protein